MLNITTEQNGNELTVILDGKLDTGTAPQLTEEANKLVDTCDVMIMDLKELSYVSSAGLRVFLATDQAMIGAGKVLKIKNVPAPIMDVFEMTGFSGVLNIMDE